MKTIDQKFLFEHYDALLLDAYGVLVNAEGPLPGASEFIETLNARNMPYAIVTNDAAKLETKISERFKSFHIQIPSERIISSAGLIKARFEELGLKGAKTVVLGSPDSHRYVKAAGGDIVSAAEALDEVRVIVVCELPGSDAFSDLEAALDAAMARLDRKAPLDLILCNPDVIYPRGARPRVSDPSQLQRTYGFTSGSLMLLLETGLRTRHAHDMPRISRLGKPFPEIFAAGRQKAGGAKKIALIGDQLPTDIRGALDYGIDAILIGTGLTRVTPGITLDPMPTYYLPNLET